jgi:hypothetical protein
MSPFESRLNDPDILATLAFIMRIWPIGLRVSQAMLPVPAVEHDALSMIERKSAW